MLRKIHAESSLQAPLPINYECTVVSCALLRKIHNELDIIIHEGTGCILRIVRKIGTEISLRGAFPVIIIYYFE